MRESDLIEMIKDSAAKVLSKDFLVNDKNLQRNLIEYLQQIQKSARSNKSTVITIVALVK
jgi:hypothetical protein